MATYKCPDCGVYHDSDVDTGDQFLACPECAKRRELNSILDALKPLYLHTDTKGDRLILVTAEGNEIQVIPDGDGYQVDFAVFVGGSNTLDDGFDTTIAKITRLVKHYEHSDD